MHRIVQPALVIKCHKYFSKRLISKSKTYARKSQWSPWQKAEPIEPLTQGRGNRAPDTHKTESMEPLTQGRVNAPPVPKRKGLMEPLYTNHRNNWTLDTRWGQWSPWHNVQAWQQSHWSPWRKFQTWQGLCRSLEPLTESAAMAELLEPLTRHDRVFAGHWSPWRKAQKVNGVWSFIM